VFLPPCSEQPTINFRDSQGAFESAPPASPEPKLAAPVGLGIHAIGNKRGGSSLRVVSGRSNPPSRNPTPIPSSPRQMAGWDNAEAEWDTVPSVQSRAHTTPVSPPMTKEDKALEIARKKEERKQRIALLKEQKKVARP